jgi:hypothetical protein
MKSLQDTLYNWLTIKVVADARPDDSAAKETFELFDDILKTEHQVSNIEVEKDEVMYFITFEKDGEKKKARFAVELIDIMYDQIEQEPEKYINYPE